MRCFLQFVGAVAVLVLVALGGWWFVTRQIERATGPDVATVARASLEGLREQNRLSAFEARYVAVITSTRRQMGLSTARTLIMPGVVRYEVDLGKLTARDVRWDAKTRTLGVRLPPVELDGPRVDMGAVRDYGDNGLLNTLTDARESLDATNRAAGQKELLQQARAAAPMKLAREATKRAVSQSFALPLRAAGIDARVDVRFADEDSGPDEQWDMSRSIADVVANRW